MRYENISEKSLQLPSGRTVKPGSTFSENDAAGLNVRALERGRVIAAVAADPEPEKKSSKKKST